MTSSSVSQAWLSISLRRCLNTPHSSSQSRITHGEAALRGRNGRLPYHRLFLDPVWGSRDAHTHECDHDGSRYSRAALCWPRTDHSFPRFACCRTEALIRTCIVGALLYFPVFLADYTGQFSASPAPSAIASLEIVQALVAIVIILLALQSRRETARGMA